MDEWMDEWVEFSWTYVRMGCFWANELRDLRSLEKTDLRVRRMRTHFAVVLSNVVPVRSHVKISENCLKLSKITFSSRNCVRNCAVALDYFGKNGCDWKLDLSLLR